MRGRLVPLFALATTVLPAQTVDSKLTNGLKFRLLGPFRGGRSVACSGVPGKPNDWYMGTCGGGLWKSENGGEDWKCVTDGFLGVGTVGAVTVSPSNTDVVYLGTGEKDIRGNISHGDGVYRSADAGKTWKHVGLRETQYVSRIVVHPQNPDVVWVAALGHVYGRNTDRGVFKSVDGGLTWRKVLYESDRAGAVDICIDPRNPDVLFCSTWEAWRTPYTLNSGGPGSKIWKSVDGGENWTDISRKPGLPMGVLGKIGVSVSPVDSQRVYALVEAANGGLFRSDNGGDTWTLMNDSREYRQRAWYYTRVVADTQEKDTVYVLNVMMGRSKDGGKTFSMVPAAHGDTHDLWIDPQDNKRMAQSNDGGTTVTLDGRKWSAQDYATAQIYHVSTDNATPYRVLGAQQDNSTIRIPSAGGSRGVGPNDWTSTAGGESGYVAAKPDDPDVVFGGSYGGDLSMLNHRTGENRAVDPWPDNPMGQAAVDSKYRFQWTFPIVFSPHSAQVLYTCSQHVHRTTNGGESWEVISPDLTRNDPRTLQSSGGPITQDNTSVEYYATVFTVAESPVRSGLIWAGSDDGLVHVTRDNGKAWKNVTPKKMPAWGLCSMIDPSPHAAGRAYLAVDNHENDDLRPYVFKTEDYGQTWKSVTSGIPDGSFVRVVREDPVRPRLLYCGTETGLFVSFDDGAHWQPLQNNLPIVPIHDLTVKNDDLVLATHGRSFWILDNLASLRQMASVANVDGPVLFAPKDTPRGGRGFGGGGGGQVSAGAQFADNPPTGMVLDYYLPKAAEKVSIQVKDAKGFVVANSSTAPNKEGFNRTSVTSFRYPGIREFPGMVTWALRGGTIPAPPGVYTVELTVDGKVLAQKARLTKNPRYVASEADLQQQFEFAMKIVVRTNEAHQIVVDIRDLVAKISAAVESKPELKAQGESLVSSLGTIEQAIYQTKSKSGQDPLNYPIRLNDKIGGLLGVVLSGDFRPTRQSYEVFEVLSQQLQVQLNAYEKLVKSDLASFNSKANALGLKEIKAEGKLSGASVPGGRGFGQDEDSGSFGDPDKVFGSQF